MMIKTTTTTTIAFDQTPTTICSGFLDIHGAWNNGFACPIENSIQYFCCGTDNYLYCCPPDQYSFESRPHIDVNNIMEHSQTFSSIITDEISASLINHQRMINKQFQQFQKYFLPTFLLTTTILFLIGIALWFWLYKHKKYYSLTRDDRIEPRTSHQIQTDSMTRLEENNYLSLDQHHPQVLSNSSTQI
ncbi:unnamed protein product [Rotaria magnacalcarata]|uniref:Shisa N-terminal domain-containing protein n=2 Tax=Rotaria magnacalcarata TaxID=392030 RepID=A0A816WY27_9BILA|nr:unnamed protein product [Rotaria magnacalcarata]CAF2139263.1 unnamed protein product [Rotaria magnacalcarata]CAF2170591.1 unnamed protein product [Rotaria magnacalcarata]CAF3904699.1 unnamed protein product [Rotaria magnacalcarata]CAF3956845.1 unnamed protein product [Rotaria magnacalcarata]